MPEQTSAPHPEKPIEVETDHRCLLGDVTDRLAEFAQSGRRGEALAEEARSLLQGLPNEVFEECCLEAYLALAPQQFDREIQLPIASASESKLDTRVLLWPVGAMDGEHPHCDGWAAYMVVQGRLAVSEQRHDRQQPERIPETWVPELLFPTQDVSHHIHNRGSDVGLTIHIFGV